MLPVCPKIRGAGAEFRKQSAAIARRLAHVDSESRKDSYCHGNGEEPIAFLQISLDFLLEFAELFREDIDRIEHQDDVRPARGSIHRTKRHELAGLIVVVER